MSCSYECTLFFFLYICIIISSLCCIVHSLLPTRCVSLQWVHLLFSPEPFIISCPLAAHFLHTCSPSFQFFFGFRVVDTFCTWVAFSSIWTLWYLFFLWYVDAVMKGDMKDPHTKNPHAKNERCNKPPTQLCTHTKNPHPEKSPCGKISTLKIPTTTSALKNNIYRRYTFSLVILNDFCIANGFILKYVASV